MIRCSIDDQHCCLNQSNFFVVVTRCLCKLTVHCIAWHQQQQQQQQLLNAWSIHHTHACGYHLIESTRDRDSNEGFFCSHGQRRNELGGAGANRFSYKVLIHLLVSYRYNYNHTTPSIFSPQTHPNSTQRRAHLFSCRLAGLPYQGIHHWEKWQTCRSRLLSAILASEIVCHCIGCPIVWIMHLIHGKCISIVVAPNMVTAIVQPKWFAQNPSTNPQRLATFLEL